MYLVCSLSRALFTYVSVVASLWDAKTTVGAVLSVKGWTAHHHQYSVLKYRCSRSRKIPKTQNEVT